MFEWAGVSLGEDEVFRLYKSVKRLGQLSGAHSLRFWGKLFGTFSDYYVVEGEAKEADESEIPKDVEPRTTGVNRLVYWVTDSLLEDWIQLPDATPAHVQAARNVKHVLTGNLNAPLNTNPLFPGKERHFLRAQIARITHATTIVPKGVFKPSEEDEKEVVPDEEFPGAETGALKSLESWVHVHANLLKAGRISHLQPDVPEDKLEEAVAAQTANDPLIERLKGINEDVPVEGNEAAWTSKLVGN